MGEVLSLDTLAPDRPLIRVKTKDHKEGRLYELAVFSDLTITDQQFLFAKGDRMKDLAQRRHELEPEEKDELELIVTKMVRMVLPDIEPELLEPLTDEQKALPEKERPSRLGGMQKLQVIEAFTLASPELVKVREAAGVTGPTLRDLSQGS